MSRAAALDLLREAIEALDADHELDRHGRDRVITATVGVFHRELDAAARAAAATPAVRRSDVSATVRRPSAPDDAARLEDLAAELRDAGLRPVIDNVLHLVLGDCPECGAQDRDPLGLWRPLQVIPRDGRTWFVCTACGQEVIR